MPFLEEGACLILWPWVGTFSGRAFNRVCLFIQGNTIFSSSFPLPPPPSLYLGHSGYHMSLFSFVAKEN